MENGKKPVVKKTAPRKKPAPRKKAVSMVSYSIKMVIPTVQYGNIQPEIIVKAGSIDDAHDFIVPHMNKLWKEYYLVDGRRPDPIPKPKPEVTPVKEPATKPEPQKEPVQTTAEPIAPVETTATETATQPPPSSVALVKATSAVQSCVSAEALELIINQVNISTKLTEADKESLYPLINDKYLELNDNKTNTTS